MSPGLGQGGGLNRATGLLAAGLALVATFFAAPVAFDALEGTVRAFALQHYPGYLYGYVGWALAGLCALGSFAAAFMFSVITLTTLSTRFFGHALG